MKRLCSFAVLMALCSSAYAGGSISFTVGGHRVHIESSRHCRSTSCASVSVSGVNERRSRSITDREEVDAGSNGATGVADRFATAGARDHAAGPDDRRLAADRLQAGRIDNANRRAAAGPPPPAPQVSIPLPPPPPPPPPPVAKPVEPVRPPAPVARVSHEAEEEVADLPIGDWQTEGKGTVRIAKCGNALCGYVLNASSNDKGEAILINMKPKTDRQWTGSVYSQVSGETYYGTMAIKGINTLRVEACALGRFYCSGNNWSRIASRADNWVTSRQVSAEPRS